MAPELACGGLLYSSSHICMLSDDTGGWRVYSSSCSISSLGPAAVQDAVWGAEGSMCDVG